MYNSIFTIFNNSWKSYYIIIIIILIIIEMKRNSIFILMYNNFDHLNCLILDFHNTLWKYIYNYITMCAYIHYKLMTY